MNWLRKIAKASALGEVERLRQKGFYVDFDENGLLNFIRKWIDRLTVRKYSVTYNMILLSLVSTMVWFLVAAVLLFRSLTGAYEPGRSDPRSVTVFAQPQDVKASLPAKLAPRSSATKDAPQGSLPPIANSSHK